MFDEPFAHGRSVVHGLDPRVRLATAGLFSLCAALLQEPSAAGAALATAMAALFLSRPPLKQLCKRVALVNVFLLFLWLTVPLTMLLTSGVGVFIERVAYRPLRRRNAPPLVFLISAIGPPGRKRS